jgi:hyperosmotically inducible protein
MTLNEEVMNMLSRFLKLLLIVFALILSLAPAAVASNSFQTGQQGRSKPRLVREREPRAVSNARTQALLAEEVRHRLVMMPLYDVFDWLEGEVKPDGTLVLRGQAVRPTLKSDAERSARDVEGIARVVNEIEVLPVSPNDDRLRAALYRAVYNFDSPLFRYATRAVPPIHIIVKNGRATLKGVVATKADSNRAYLAASGVPGLFEVTNELRVESEAARS